jgi:hypothetical protein
MLWAMANSVLEQFFACQLVVTVLYYRLSCGCSECDPASTTTCAALTRVAYQHAGVGRGQLR